MIQSDSKTIIKAYPAAEKVKGYLKKKNDVDKVLTLFADEFYFKLDTDFPYESFEDSLFAHAYFAVSEGQLSLLFISKKADHKLAEDLKLGIKLITDLKKDLSKTVVYEAPLVPTETRPNDIGFVYQEMIENWDNHHQTWLSDRVNSTNGLTLVSVVPFQDVTSHYKPGRELQVYLGLRLPKNVKDNTVESLELSLLFYDPKVKLILPNKTDDFSSPKPPFGYEEVEKNYGLLKLAKMLP